MVTLIIDFMNTAVYQLIITGKRGKRITNANGQVSEKAYHFTKKYEVTCFTDMNR